MCGESIRERTYLIENVFLFEDWKEMSCQEVTIMVNNDMLEGNKAGDQTQLMVIITD